MNRLSHLVTVGTVLATLAWSGSGGAGMTAALAGAPGPTDSSARPQSELAQPKNAAAILAGDSLVPIAPRRIYRGWVTSGTTRSISPTRGSGVPAASTAAVMVQITATRATRSSEVTAWPAGSPPPTDGTLAVIAGRPEGSLAVVRLGNDGQIRLRVTSGRTRISVVELGVEKLAGATGDGSSIVAVPPADLLGVDGARVDGGNAKLVRVSGRHNVPRSGVSGLIAAVTTTPEGSAGALTVSSRGARGQVVRYARTGARTELIDLPADAAGQLRFTVTGGAARVRAQLVGYETAFAAPRRASATDVPLVARSILDTTGPIGGHHRDISPSAPVTLDVLGHGGIPGSGVAGVWLNVTSESASENGSLAIRSSAGAAATTVAVTRGQRLSTLTLAKPGADGTLRLVLKRGHSKLQVAVVGYLRMDNGPGTLSDLTAKADPTGTIDLSWTRSSAVSISKIIVRRAAGARAPASQSSGRSIGALGPTATSTTDRSTAPNTTYTYAAYLVDDIGKVGPRATTQVSTQMAGYTPAPAGLSIDQADDSTVSLDWTDPETSDLQAIEVRRLDGPVAPGAGQGEAIADLAAGVSSYRDSGLSPGKIYSYAVFARYPNGESVPATIVAATNGVASTAPAPLANLQATADGLTARLTWARTQGDQAVVIRRAVGDTPPATPNAGIAVAVVGVADPAQPTMSYSDSGLDGATRYSYSLFAVDSLGDYSAAGSDTVSMSAANGTVDVCGVLTGRLEWSPSSAAVYVLTCSVTVMPGASLTLDPGTIVKTYQPYQAVQLLVYGTLRSDGTASEPVTMTSLRDDSVGGDTNGDGSQTAPAPGDWGGIGPWVGNVNHLTGDESVTLDHTVVDYAGTSEGYYGANAVSVVGAATVIDSTIENCSGGDALAIFTGGDSDPDVDSNLVDSCSSGLVVSGIDPKVVNNTVNDVDDAPISVTGSAITPDHLTGNNGSNDTPDAIGVAGTLAADLTVPSSGMPFQFGSLTIAPAATLTVAPGDNLDADLLDVQGTLVAEGTSGAPVAGSVGDIRTDPIAGSPAPSLDFAYANLGASMLVTGDSQVTASDSQFAGVGFDPGPGSDVDFESNEVTLPPTGGDGIIVDTTNAVLGAEPVVEDNTVTGASAAAISVTGPAIDPRTLSGNVGSDNGLNAIGVTGTLIADLTLPMPGLPWVILPTNTCTRYGASQCTTGLVIAPSATVTLNPGGTLRAAPPSTALYPGYDEPSLTATLFVEGALIGTGTSVDPAVITSVHDPSVGPDPSNMSTAPAAGDWNGIVGVFEAGMTPVIDLVHTRIAYLNGIEGGTGPFTMTDDQVEHIGVPSVGTEDPVGSSIEASTATEAPVDIESTTVSDSQWAGIAVTETDGVTPTVANNDVLDAAGAAIVIQGVGFDPSKITGNSGSVDQPAAVVFGGTLGVDFTVPKSGLPWVVGGGSCGPATCDELVVPSGKTLTLTAGTVLKVYYAGLSYEYYYGAAIDVQGALRAEGTPADPVVMTSLRDDSVGGDTGGDGSATAPAPGDWSMLADQVIGDPAPVVDLTDTDVDYISSVMASGASHLTMTGGAVTKADQAASVGLRAGGTFDFENETVSQLGGDGIDLLDSSTRPQDSPIVKSSSFADVGGAAMNVSAQNFDPTLLTGNTAVGDGLNAIEVSGTFVGDATVPTSGLPWVLASSDVAVRAAEGVGWRTNSLTVLPGRSLTIPAGAVLRAVSLNQATLVLEGDAVSDGTVANPAIFTSVSDPSVPSIGTLTTSTAPLAGQWQGIVVAPQVNQQPPQVSLPNTVVEYASTALTVLSGNATVTGRINNDTNGVVGPAKDGNGNCTNGTVTATPVDWGTPTGPAPYGTGPAVSGCVTVQPWVGE
jgi:hypothetical protein